MLKNGEIRISFLFLFLFLNNVFFLHVKKRIRTLFLFLKLFKNRWSLRNRKAIAFFLFLFLNNVFFETLNSVDSMKWIGFSVSRILAIPVPYGRDVRGGIAQLVERCLCKADVSGSTPLISNLLRFWFFFLQVKKRRSFWILFRNRNRSQSQKEFWISTLKSRNSTQAHASWIRTNAGAEKRCGIVEFPLWSDSAILVK